MTWQVDFSPLHAAQLRQHLLQGDDEQAAFLFASFHDSVLHVEDVALLGGADIECQSPWQISLDDAVRPRVIKRAWDEKRALIEMHSHRHRGAAKFSPSDLSGFAEFVPHVMWRLPDRPYAALVFSEDSADGLIWTTRGSEPKTIGKLVIGRDAILPTGLTLAQWETVIDE